jgi:hypothetical protein
MASASEPSGRGSLPREFFISIFQTLAALTAQSP